MSKTVKLMLALPKQWAETIDGILQPMQTRQDFIRMAVQEKLEQLPKQVEAKQPRGEKRLVKKKN